MIPLDPHESVECVHYEGPPGHVIGTCCCCDGRPCELVTPQHESDHKRWLWMALTQEDAAS